MSVNTTSLKFKVLGFGAAAVIGAAMLLGATNSATAATYTCNSATAGGGPGNGTCYNDGTQGNPTGDFGDNTDWSNAFGFWTLSYASIYPNSANFDESQFGSPANKAVGGQSAANVEIVMESADWFGKEFFLVGQVDDIGGQTGLLSTALKGNLYYLHAGNNAMAWYFDDIQDGFDVTSGSDANGWSNLRVYSTIAAVPIPAALPLFGAALLGLGILSRRRKNKTQQA